MALHKKAKTKPLAVLSEEDRFEYAMRHNLLLQKQMEYNALAAMQDGFRDAIVAKYGLPDKFDLTLATGEVFRREEPHAENGRV